MNINWRALWREFDEWWREFDGLPSLRRERAAIKRLVEKQLRVAEKDKRPAKEKP